MNFIRTHHPRPGLTPVSEQASWMIVAAAERLADAEPNPARRAMYSEAGRRMLRAVRSPVCDDRSLRAAAPTVTRADGPPLSLIAAIGGNHGDPESGFRQAMKIFLKSDWRSAC